MRRSARLISGFDVGGRRLVTATIISFGTRAGLGDEMNAAKPPFLAIAMAICSTCFAQGEAEQKRCIVTRPHADSGQTVAAQMIVVNDGEPCEMHVGFGGGPAMSVTIRAKPSNGTLTGKKSPLFYTPNPGFVGKDAFDVTWFGIPQGANYISHNVRTKVEVTVRARNGEPARASPN